MPTSPLPDHAPRPYMVQPAAFVRPLDYWLASDAATMMPAQISSKLGDIAWNFGQLRGMCGAFAGMGLSLLGGGLLVLAHRPGLGALWISFVAAGAALVVLGALVLRAKSPRIAQQKQFPLSRAAPSLRSGVGMALFLFAITGGALALALFPWVSEGPAGVLAYAGILVMYLLFLASIFVIPGYFSEHAGRDLRRRIVEKPAFRTELESMSLSWRDEHGTRSFGPL